MTDINFSDLDFHYTDSALIVRPDSATNFEIPFASIVQVHLAHYKRRKFPYVLIELKDGNFIRIDGYRRFHSSPEEREAYRNFVIDFHQRISPFKRDIKFTAGIDMPKSVSVILAVAGAALLAFNIKREFFTAEGLGFPFAMIVVGLITFFGKGHEYDPLQIPGKFLR